MNNNAKPSEYKVSVSGSQNPNGYLTVSQVEAKYPAAPVNSPPMEKQNAAVGNAGQPATKADQSATSVDYVVPPPQQIFDGTTSGLNEKQQQQQQPPVPQGLKQPGQATSQPSNKQTNNDILDIKLEERPVKQEPASSSKPAAISAVPHPRPAPQKVPSAKNYPIDLVLLKEQPLLGVKPEGTESNLQPTYVKLARPLERPAQVQGSNTQSQQKVGSAPADSQGYKPTLVSSPPYNAIQPQQAYAQQQTQATQQTQQYQQGKDLS